MCAVRSVLSGSVGVSRSILSARRASERPIESCALSGAARALARAVASPQGASLRQRRAEGRHATRFLICPPKGGSLRRRRAEGRHPASTNRPEQPLPGGQPRFVRTKRISTIVGMLQTALRHRALCYSKKIPCYSYDLS